MARRQKSSSSVSTLQIFGLVVVLLAVCVALAVMFAPQKPLPPPTSAISYAERPQLKPQPGYDDRFPDDLPRRDRPRAAMTRAAEAISPAEEAPPEPYTVACLVRDGKTGAPLSGVQVVVARVWTAEEHEDWCARNDEMIKKRDGTLWDELREQEKRLNQSRAERTDDAGRCEVSVGLTGTYTVEAVCAGYIPVKMADEEITEGQPRLELEIELSTGATISGRVAETGSSAGAQGVPVQVTSIDEQTKYLYSWNWSSNQPKTDEDGKYLIGGLVPGEYEVTLELSDTPYKVGREIPFQKIKITNPNQEIKGVDFTVDPAGIVWGYVTTPDLEPIRADVLLCTSESVLSQALASVMRRAPPLNDHTEEDGYYELIGVPLNEEWRVYVTAEDHSPQLADPFVLTPAKRTVRVDVFMFAGTTVYGRVVDPKRNPIPKAELMCIPGYSKLVSPLETPQAFREATSDEYGEFKISELPAGSYQIFAMKRGFKLSMSGEPIYPNGYSNITGLEIVLESADQGTHVVYGTVMDTARTAVAGADIHLAGFSMQSMDSVSRETTTDGNGQFVIEGVEIGTYQMEVRKEGYATRHVSRVLLDRENMVVLEASGVVRGTVLVRETRRPPDEICYVSATGISGIGAGSVDLAAMLDGVGGRSTSTDNGVFELYLPAGTYRLEAKAAGFTPGRAEVSVATGSVTDGVEIFISKGGGRISGRVVVSDGKSPQGATVMLVETGSSIEAAVIAGFADGMGDREVRVGSDGVFSFENLPAGTYSAIARHPSYASADSGPLELAEQGNITNVELRMGVGGALEGYVYVANRATAGVVVMVLGQGTTKTVITDQNGHYYVDGLATGTYQAMITSVGSGDLSGIFETRGVPVEIMDGRTTRYDFGRGTGTRIEGRCTPGPQLAGTAVLRTPGPQVVALGQTVQLNQLVGGWNTLINPLDGGFVLEDIPPGEWQLDIFFMEFATGVRYMHSEIITVQGEQVLPLDISIKF